MVLRAALINIYFIPLTMEKTAACDGKGIARSDEFTQLSPDSSVPLSSMQHFYSCFGSQALTGLFELKYDICIYINMILYTN